MTLSQSPITLQELSAKRETACWGNVWSWRGLVSIQSETVWHRSNRNPDDGFPYRLTAELTCEQLSGEDSFRVIVREESLRISPPNLGQSEITWLESPTFPTLSDAQRYADWAITVWHQQGTFAAAGFTIRWDLDQKGNPTG